MKRVLPLLVAFAATAREPRFLGPPVKAPPDAGTSHSAAEADKPVLNVGDDAPLVGGAVHNPEAVGAPAINFGNWVGPDADSDQQAKALLVSFFATWCKPCKKEMPFLQSLYTQYKDKGLRVISVAIDKDEAQFPVIKQLIAQNNVTFPVLKDRFNLIARQYLGEKTALPSVFIIGKDGRVVMVKQGYEKDAAEFLKGEVEKALQ